MVAYKIWHNTKHYIHKDTTDDMDIKWAENIEDAKVISGGIAKAMDFFYYSLGFNMNAVYNKLYIA
jgi:hypothetical protein